VPPLKKPGRTGSDERRTYPSKKSNERKERFPGGGKVQKYPVKIPPEDFQPQVTRVPFGRDATREGGGGGGNRGKKGK